MQLLRKIKDTEEDRARARLLAYFEDHPTQVFYSRQLEVLFEGEYFHWVTNRALRRLINEGRIHTEARHLSTGSEIKLVWHKRYRFYKRAADEVFKIVDQYTKAATDGTLGLQGEHLVLAAFARQKFLLIGEESRTYLTATWEATKHNLDFIFQKDGIAYGVEVKNTLGYLDLEEFVIKIRLARHIGVIPVFAVRALPKTWAHALIQAGGYAMIMRYQFYPWTHRDVAAKIKERLGLPVDTPKHIEQGTMQRFENWISSPTRIVTVDDEKVERLLKKMDTAYRRVEAKPEVEDSDELQNE